MIDNTELSEAISRAAGAVVRRYGSFVTYEDLVQDGWEWALRSPDRLEHYEFKDGGVYRNGLTSDLVRHMTRIAKRSRQAVLGQAPSDQYTYDRVTVELVLPAVWDSNYRPPAVEAAGRSSRDPATSSLNWESMVADVRSAVEQLPARLRRILLAYYGVGPHGGWREVATALGISKTVANSLGIEAVGRVVDLLNGVPDIDAEPTQKVGTRRVLSNAQAAAVTSGQWEG